MQVARPEWKWYVYEVERDGRVVYVGKGCGKRMRASAKERGGCPVQIACFREERDALAFERNRIAARLTDGLELLNISHGNAVRQTPAEIALSLMARIKDEATLVAEGDWPNGAKLVDRLETRRESLRWLAEIAVLSSAS